MNHRNGKKYADQSETPEEVVALIGNIGNRKDIRDIQERQIKEIKALVLSHMKRIEREIETNIMPSVEYLDIGDCKNCAFEAGFHTAECTLHNEFSRLMYIIEDIKKQYE